MEVLTLGRNLDQLKRAVPTLLNESQGMCQSSSGAVNEYSPDEKYVKNWGLYRILMHIDLVGGYAWGASGPVFFRFHQQIGLPMEDQFRGNVTYYDSSEE
jgi:hypothetical protein